MKLVVTLSLVTSVAWAQSAPEADFTLPQFPSDGGVPAVSSPPSPPVAKAPEKPKPPPLPHWGTLSGQAGALLVGNRSLFLGVDLFVGRVFASANVATEAEHTYISGWVFEPGFEGSLGRWGSSLCFGPAFCGTRFTGGLGLRTGWARGVVDSRSGSARPGVMYFAQLGILGGYIDIPSAPLAPGGAWGELMLRGRLGVQFSQFAELATPSTTNFIGSLAFVTEGVVVCQFSRGVTFGVAGGLAF